MLHRIRGSPLGPVPPMTLPLTILGGYLGAGKTTVVNHLLRHADGLRLAVLVNEFGELPIDADLIEAQDDDIISIAGGCVCCSYGNDLTLALMDMAAMDPPPDHVLLEASGVALPGAIAASVSLLAGYALDGVVVMCNAETIRDHAADPYIGDTVARQLADADLVVLNKTDLVEDAEGIAAWLAPMAAGAQVVGAEHGALPPEVLLQSFVGRERRADGPAHRADLFRSAAYPVEERVDADALAAGLAGLGLVRAKGFVDGAAGRVAVQTVGRRGTVSPAPDALGTGVVAIGVAEAFDGGAVQGVIERCTLTRNS